MGGSLGCHRSIPKDPTDVWSRRKFSAACSFSHVTVYQERLNINTATEEELMTLPGVDRAVAQNIVEYRHCIGGFKKIQDLALVSGVGADKLEVIKLEICVSSRSSSSQHSPSSVRKDSHGLIHGLNAKDRNCPTSNGLSYGLDVQDQNCPTSNKLIYGLDAQDQNCPTSNKLIYGLSAKDRNCPTSNGLSYGLNAPDQNCPTSNKLIYGLNAQDQNCPTSNKLIYGLNAKDRNCPTSNGLSYGLNINSVTAAELVSVTGLTENIANDIITFRMENGSFKTMKDLLKVHSVDSSLFEKVCLHLHVQRSRAASTISSFAPQPSPTTCSETEDQEESDIPSPSDQDLPPGGPAQIPWSRPSTDLLPGLKDLRPALKLASWSLQSCSIEKATNPGVREVLCMTLLENSVSLLAVQDVLDPEALEKFCAELNQGSLSCFRRWKSPRGVWKSVVSDRPTRLSTNHRNSFCGFMWDASSGVDLKETAILDFAVANGNKSHGQPGLYSAVFTVGNNELKIINVHLPPANEEGGADDADGANVGADARADARADAGADAGANGGANDGANAGANSGANDGANAGANDGANAGANSGANDGANAGANDGANAGVLRLLSILQDTVRAEKELLVVGDFGCSPHASQLEVLRKEKMSALVPSTQFTNISTSSPQGTRCLDNIWIKSLKKLHTGRCVVVREGLTNPWIPDGWSWGGVASDHCPITVELYLDTHPKAPPLYRPGVTVDRCEAQDKLER